MHKQTGTMNMKLINSILLGVFSLTLIAQTVPDPGLIRDMQRTVCAIKVMSGSGGPGSGVAVGCGVVLMADIDGQETYFVATANHIVKGLFENSDAVAEIMAFDMSGIMYKTVSVKKKHIVWRNPELDAALILLPPDVRPEGQIPMGYRYQGLAHLKKIGEPLWGQDIYLFGYRWMNEERFIDILKKGILSVGTTELPGYKGNLVFLIDNMANKGMSGGLAYTVDGTGIGIISSYVYEVNSRLQGSDDLTVCLPLAFYMKALEDIIAADKDKLKQFNDD
jgi:hypothetical protein